MDFRTVTMLIEAGITVASVVLSIIKEVENE